MCSSRRPERLANAWSSRGGLRRSLSMVGLRKMDREAARCWPISDGGVLRAVLRGVAMVALKRSKRAATGNAEQFEQKMPPMLRAWPQLNRWRRESAIYADAGFDPDVPMIAGLSRGASRWCFHRIFLPGNPLELGAVHSSRFVFTSCNLDGIHESTNVERCPMGTDFRLVARQAHRQRGACGRQSSVCRSGSIHGASRQPLA